MSAVRLLPDPVQDAGAATGLQSPADWTGDGPSFDSAVRTLLDDLRSGRLSAATVGDRWLVERIEEALVGFDNVAALAAGEEVVAPPTRDHPAGSALISADRVAG